MIIGLEAGISFTSFIGYLAVCEVALWGISIFVLYMLFRSRLGEKKELPEYNPWESVEDKKLFYRSIVILILLVVLFFLAES